MVLLVLKGEGKGSEERREGGEGGGKRGKRGGEEESGEKKMRNFLSKLQCNNTQTLGPCEHKLYVGCPPVSPVVMLEMGLATLPTVLKTVINTS